jgi:hypothetical protein
MIEKLTEGKSDINSIREKCLSSGWKVTDPSFSLARSQDSLDIIKEKQRIFYYKSNPQDAQAAQILKRNQLIQFEEYIQPQETGDIKAVKVPRGALPLSKIHFKEDDYTGGFYDGGFEILSKLAQLISNIHRRTGMYPDINLDRVSYTSGCENPLRLIPPYSLGKEFSLDNIVGSLKKNFDELNIKNSGRYIESIRSLLIPKE